MKLPNPLDYRLGDGQSALLAVAYFVLCLSTGVSIFLAFAALVMAVGPWALLLVPTIAIVVIAYYARKLHASS